MAGGGSAGVTITELTTAAAMPPAGHRAVLMASEAEQTLELAAVEADDDFVSDEDDGHRRPARSRQQLRTGGRVLGDVLRLERHTFLRKKLFRQVTAASAGRPV